MINATLVVAFAVVLFYAVGAFVGYFVRSRGARRGLGLVAGVIFGGIALVAVLSSFSSSPAGAAGLAFGAVMTILIPIGSFALGFALSVPRRTSATARLRLVWLATPLVALALAPTLVAAFAVKEQSRRMALWSRTVPVIFEGEDLELPAHPRLRMIANDYGASFRIKNNTLDFCGVLADMPWTVSRIGLLPVQPDCGGDSADYCEGVSAAHTDLACSLQPDWQGTVLCDNYTGPGIALWPPDADFPRRRDSQRQSGFNPDDDPKFETVTAPSGLLDAAGEPPHIECLIAPHPYVDYECIADFAVSDRLVAQALMDRDRLATDLPAVMERANAFLTDLRRVGAAN